MTTPPFGIGPRDLCFRRSAPDRWTAVLFVSFLIGVASADSSVPDSAQSLSPALGIPNFAFITAIEGLPPDSLGGREFRNAFSSVFVETSFRTERESVKAGEWLPSIPISNRFRQLMGDNHPDAWQVQVSLRSVPSEPPARGVKRKPPRASAAPRDTAFEVVVFARSPAAVAAGARVLPERDRLSFPMPGGARAAFARQCGRATALVTLELLHHLSDDLAADERLRIDGATRGAPNVAPLLDSPIPTRRR